VRESLPPLAPGERPTAVTVAAVIAFLFAIANVIAAVFGESIAGDDSNAIVSTAFFSVILVVAGVGMLLARYWAVLGFQALLALQIITLTIALVRVEKWWVGLLVAAAVAGLGYLFWKLVRAMARIQMPERPTPRSPGA
jgi:hypothetical protein